MKWVPYPKYKPSEWLGEIPEHWEVAASKRIGSFQAGAGFPDDEQGLADEELPFYKVSDTNLEGNDVFMVVHNNSISRDTAARLRAFVFPPGTIVFAKVGAALLLNKRRILVRESCIDNNMMGFMPRSCDVKWAYYWMCELDLGELANPGAVPSVNEGQLRDVPVPVPPIDEQRAIAAFLDRETARIDALIKKKERQIELLQEKRATVISHAVTKGLNPNVKMKDSGIEWLGEIPEHWEVKRIKHIGRIKYGLGEPPRQLDDGLPFIRATDIHRGKINSETILRVDPEDIPWSRDPELRANDILVVRSGAYTGDSAIVPKEWAGAIAGYDMVLRVTNALPYFIAYALLSKYLLEGQIYLERSRAAQPHLNAEELGAFIVLLPPKEEQEEIVFRLDCETARIDALIQKIRKSIELLREYRTALITAAVTGKIEVREEVA